MLALLASEERKLTSPQQHYWQVPNPTVSVRCWRCCAVSAESLEAAMLFGVMSAKVVMHRSQQVSPYPASAAISRVVRECFVHGPIVACSKRRVLAEWLPRMVDLTSHCCC
jgi:hypothetical protein